MIRKNINRQKTRDICGAFTSFNGLYHTDRDNCFNFCSSLCCLLFSFKFIYSTVLDYSL